MNGNNTWAYDANGYSCYVKHCIITMHNFVTRTLIHHDSSLGLHYARTLRWPIAAVMVALLICIALVATHEKGEEMVEEEPATTDGKIETGRSV